MSDRWYVRLCWAILALGTLLRVGLCWLNPPWNAFDDHFEPILLFLETGSIPLKTDCFECYHPPVFYVLSGILWRAVAFVSGATEVSLKVLQLVACVCGVLTLFVVRAILDGTQLSKTARLTGLLLVACLPRHIYLSAIHSNDAASFLLAALGLLWLFRILDRGPSAMRIGLCTSMMTLAVFTKYTALAVLPAAAVALVGMAREGHLTRIRAALVAVALLVVPTALFVAQGLRDRETYGDFVPEAVQLASLRLDFLPGKGNLSFADFHPVDLVEEPILTPAATRSFWTLMYGRMWFDMEPKFLQYVHRDDEYWLSYLRHLYGEASEWPGVQLPRSVWLSGSLLMILGMAPVLVGLVGTARLVRTWFRSATEGERRSDPIKCTAGLAMIAATFLGLGVAALTYPYYPMMKAGYTLSCLAPFALLYGYGLDGMTRAPALRATAVASLCALAAVASVHALHLIGGLYANA